MSVLYPSASRMTVVAAVVAVMSVQPTSENVISSQPAAARLLAKDRDKAVVAARIFMLKWLPIVIIIGDIVERECRG